MPIGEVSVAAYLEREPGPFLAHLTHQLAPHSPLRRPHVTLLPPRLLHLSDEQLLQRLRRVVPVLPPITIHLGKVSTFLPVSPVVYLEVSSDGDDIDIVHGELLRSFESSAAAERFRFHPHLTLAYDIPEPDIRDLTAEFAHRWAAYKGPREYLIERLTLVREGEPLHWRELGSVVLKARPHVPAPAPGGNVN